MVERERARLLDSSLSEQRRCHHHRQNSCRTEDFESGHRLVSPSVDPLRDLGLAKISRLVQVRGISENANTFRNRILAPSASTDVQTLVELLIELLLLGVECRQPLLFKLFRRGARRNLIGARLQMTDRRLWHRCYRAWERVGIGHCATEQDSTDEDNCG
jgi:hypothetical protein